MVSAFSLIIRRSLEIKHSLEERLNDNSWGKVFADFSETARK